MLKAIFNIILYEDDKLTIQGTLIKPGTIVDKVRINKNYAVVHIINDYYISLEQLSCGFEKITK